jgi:cell division protein FtsN
MKRLFLTFIFVSLSAVVLGQSAESYFHNSAQSFINADLQQAIQEAQQGLQQYPNNPKLNALMQKLQEEQQRQQQQQDQENQEQQQEEQEQQQDQQQGDQKQQQQEQQDQQQQEQGENQDEQNPEDMNPENMDMQKISKQEAEKILQALAQKEKELLKEFKKKKTNGSAKHEKDW